MARPRSNETEIRDRNLLRDIKRGVSPADAAVKYNISRSMVSQILVSSAETEEELPEEMRARLIQLADRQIEIATEIAEGPGRAITSGKGDHVLDAVTGQPAYDPSPRLDALRQIDAASTKLAKLMAAEKQPPKVDASSDPGFMEQYEWLVQATRENETLKRQLAQLQAQVRLLENSEPAQIVE